MEIHTHSETETIELGKSLLTRFPKGGVVALVGDLGSGKTHLTKGIALAAGFDGSVTSPTFTLVHEYVGSSQEVCHFDFYRLNSENELWDIGWDDYLDRGAVLVVEWADRFPDALPPETLWIDLAHAEDGGRLIQLRDGEQGGAS